MMAQRRAEADEFYAELTPAGASADEALVLRQASAGMLWSKQLFYYDVARWLDGDPGQPAPPAVRKDGRNSRWRNFDGFDIISMPDKWEYPWFAAWDLAFHTVPLAHLDPAFAKYQLILICREWFQHPQGALPAYEWDFGDVNPPVHAWAALQVWAIDGGRDLGFLARVFAKLLVNFTWWVNREDANGNNVFEGGFLGLDNIGPIDRSHLPAGYTLEQSDATGWMGAYALALGTIAAVLNRSGQPQQQPGPGSGAEVHGAFRGHPHRAGRAGPVGRRPTGCSTTGWSPRPGYSVPVKVHSMVGIIPALAAGVLDGDMLHNAMTMNKLFMPVPAQAGRRGHPEAGRDTRSCAARAPPSGCCCRWPGPPSWNGCSPSCSTKPSSCPRTGCARCRPTTASTPTSSTPRATSPPSTMSRPSRPPPCSAATPTGAARSGCRSTTWSSNPSNATPGSTAMTSKSNTPPAPVTRLTLDLIIADLQDRLISLFTRDENGRRACFGGTEKMQTDPAWKDNLIFSEYFHGDNGAAIGAFHQTGWTGLIADVILRRHGAVRPLGDVLRDPAGKAQP